MSSTVSDAATGITRQSDSLRIEVEQFLLAMRETSSDRRRFERHVVKGVTAVLKLGERQVTCPVLDISLGGCRVDAVLPEPSGTELLVQLPGADRTVAARIVDTQATNTGLFFTQVEDARQVIGEVIARLVPQVQRAA
jgi:hypothetical protein